LRYELALAVLFLLVALVAVGCVSGVQSSPYANAVMCKQIYNLSNVSSWKYMVEMSARGTNSTWNMTVNNTYNPRGESYMDIATLGNGMDIRYDVWYNASTYQIDRVHARGSIGNYYQDRNTSTQQIYTLPDTGLIYYFVPLQYAGVVTVQDASEQPGQLGAFTATDNKGFRLTYWANQAMVSSGVALTSPGQEKVTVDGTSYTCTRYDYNSGGVTYTGLVYPTGSRARESGLGRRERPGRGTHDAGAAGLGLNFRSFFQSPVIVEMDM
jgi:hypothetical protein